MKLRIFIANCIFFIHIAIGIVWWGLFLAPNSLHNKVSFHFYLTIIIVAHQFIWGAILFPRTKKFRMVCILTTPMQLLRGQKISDPKNYDHLFLKELIGKTGINISHSFSTILTFIILIIVSIEYLFFRH